MTPLDCWREPYIQAVIRKFQCKKNRQSTPGTTDSPVHVSLATGRECAALPGASKRAKSSADKGWLN